MYTFPSIKGRQISNLRCADDTTLLAQSEEDMAMLLQLIEDIEGRTGKWLKVKIKY